MRFFDVIHPDFKELVKERCSARQRRENVIPRYEFKIVRKDGAERWIDFTEGRINWMGKPTAIGTAFDITERKNAEESLIASEERYRMISEMISDFAYSLRIKPDKSLKFEWIVGAVERITGYTLDEILSKSGRDQSSFVHPEDRKIWRQHVKNILKGKPHQTEYRRIRKDGKIRWLKLSTKPIFDEKQDRVIRILSAGEDITQRKQAEEEIIHTRENYERFFMEDLTGDFFCTFDGNITSCNPAFLRILDLSSLEEATASNIFDFLKNPDDKYKLISRMQRERKLEYVELELKKKDNSSVYTIANIMGVHDKNDKLIEIRGTSIR